MKISKHLHSCLLIEENEKTILIDPGSFTYQEKALDISKINQLDNIVITHEHADHFHFPFIQELLQKFPTVQIITNPSVSELLKEKNIPSSINSTNDLQNFEVKHEKIWMGEAPQNYQFDVFNKLTHPGDSLSFASTKEILALPITAPWGSTTWAVETALKLQPKIIIPIHDWHWKDEVRLSMYSGLQKFFEEKGIRFIPLETNQIIEL